MKTVGQLVNERATPFDEIPESELAARRDVRDRCAGVVHQWSLRKDVDVRQLLFLLNTMPLKLKNEQRNS